MRPRTREIGWGAGPWRPVLATGEKGSSDQAAQKRPDIIWPAFHDMVTRLAVLESAPVFYTMPEPVLRALARRLRRIRIPSGEMVVFQGDPGDTIFFIEEGRCRVVVERPPGTVTVAVLTAGDFVGEGACVLNRRQQASVYAQSECILLGLDRQSLLAVLGGWHQAILDALTPELITRAIAVLRKTFRYIVVDLGVTITDSTLALFDLTQHIVLVAAPELSAVKSAADAIEILTQLGTPHDRLTVVLNNRSVKPPVTRPAVERMLKREVNVEVAFDGTKPEQAAVDGVILSAADARSEMTRGCLRLATLLDATHGRVALQAKALVGAHQPA